MRARKLLPVVLGAIVLGVQAHLASADQYQVRWGDTLEQVAGRLGVSVQALAAANGITDPNLIIAGHMLVVPSDGGAATEYLVRKGDTLTGISSRVGVPVAELAAANGLDDPNWVPAGRLLSVPPVGVTRTAAAAGGGAAGTYIVRPGDALGDIALKFGVPVGQLAADNDVTDPNLIQVGQVLSVPKAVWRCPVPEGTFVNDFGYVREDGGIHKGVDLFAPTGTPILAPVGGLVERYPNRSGGNALHLWGRDGNRYYFAHLDSYGEAGTVGGGAIIGYVGNTGDARMTSSHLHFEIHPDDGPAVNPFPSLVPACR